MSFASETKKELVSLPVSDCCARAELSALMHLNGHLTLSAQGMRLEFLTQNAAIARRFVKLLRQLYDVKLEVLTRRLMRLNKNNVYIVRVIQYTHMIATDLQLLNESGINTHIAPELIQKPCCKRAYLRGAFLATGSVNNPETSAYHLEITTLKKTLAEDIQHLMNAFDLNARILERKKGYIIYLKESEKIVDFLRVIQANNAVLDYEDIRIIRDMRNSVNRIRNCEIANLNRSWDAANQQLENIDLIEKTYGLEALSDKELAVAKLRRKYPEATLTELSEYYQEEYHQPISKSGINHRLRKINALAEQIRKQLEGQ
ncbi:MAG TPA: DNA-binding protein WhiA [Haloplasmataceae bacterium]